MGKGPTRRSSGAASGGTFAPDAYRAIFEASPDGVLVIDEAGVIRELNHAAERIFGYSPGDLVGRNVDVLVPDPFRGVHAAHREGYMADPRPRPMGIGMELQGRRSDGVELPVEISLSPLAREDGAPWVIATVRDVTQRRRLRNFSTGALRATEEERQRIARELHDDTAQRLTALLVMLKVLERSEGEERERRFREFRAEIAEAAESVRQIARGLRPPELEDSGVGLALMAHARGLQERGGLRVELDVEPVDHLLGRDAQLVLYRIVQEALSNVLRHSGAAGARVEIRRDGGRVRALVEDRGRGFEPGRGDLREGALGIIGMQERAAMVGGEVAIESRPGEGTRVRVALPLDGDPYREEVRRG